MAKNLLLFLLAAITISNVLATGKSRGTRTPCATLVDSIFNLWLIWMIYFRMR